jgi:hypothetical protein
MSILWRTELLRVRRTDHTLSLQYKPEPTPMALERSRCRTLIRGIDLRVASGPCSKLASWVI